MSAVVFLENQFRNGLKNYILGKGIEALQWAVYIMKILYIDGHVKEKAGTDIVQALRDMGHDVQTYSECRFWTTVLYRI